jgi:hypothetical protein
MCLSPVAGDNLSYRIQSLAAGRLYGKFQHKLLCVWATHHLKPDSSEQGTPLAECQLPISGEFVNIKPRALDITQIWFFNCRICVGITYQSTMGHRLGSPCSSGREIARAA